MAGLRRTVRRRFDTSDQLRPHLHQDIDALLAQPAPLAAPQLLGWTISVPGVIARITEVEAYHGEADRACHASRGRTRRTQVLYQPAGTLYVYRCYGVHWMLNIVCDAIEVPSAVLVRSVEIIGGEALARDRRGLTSGLHPRSDPRLLANGPGKVCQVLGLSGREHDLHLHDPQLSLQLSPPERIIASPHRARRVGVDYAGRFWSARHWRWWVPGFPVAGHRS